MTTTPRYRIGNDMTILWAINNKDGSPYDMSGKEVRLFMTHRQGREEVRCTVVTLPDGTVNNVIRWSFAGDDQKVLGPYALTASIYTSDDLKLIRKDICEAFELVGVSCMECEEDGDAVINDGGDLILSSKLDIYRFGIPKIHISPDGYWFIDNVNTGVSALGGDPGMVRNIYQVEHLDNSFVPESKIDTFNAYAIASLAKRIKNLESEDYLQIRNMTDVLLTGDLVAGQALVWDGTRWTNKIVATKATGGGGVSEDYENRLIAVEKLLNWFSFDEETRQIKASYGLYTYGGLTAGGKGQLGGAGLGDLANVEITSPANGQALVYDSTLERWVNKAVEASGSSGEGVSASLTQDIKSGVALGYIKKNDVLTQGMTLTEVFIKLLTADVTTQKPSVKLINVPGDAEVGSVINFNLSHTYTDGKFGNTSNGNVNAGCEELSATYYLDGQETDPSYSLTTSGPKTHKVKVNVQYGASTNQVQNAAGENSDASIPAGTATSESSFMVSYRYFWGYMTDEEYENINSTSIRNLEQSGSINPSASKITLLDQEHEIPGGEDLIIAVPMEYKVEAIDMTTSRPIKFPTPAVMMVKCGGTMEKSYRVYRYDNYTAYPMYITKITIEKEA